MSGQEREMPVGLERKPLASPERRERPNSLGVALLIVGLDPSRNGENESDPLIWTIIELNNKGETEKSAGQISIPSETRKNGESTEDNVLGALAEFCDDTLFSEYVKGHVVKMDGKWHRERGIFVGAGPADVAVLIFDGALDFPLKSSCPDEVSPHGWMKKSELVVSPNLRDALRQALELDDKENLIRDTLESYQKNPENRKLVFPESLNSIQKFNNNREFGLDVEVMPSSAKEVGKRLPEARKLIIDAIDLLVDSQGQEKRSYKREEAIVSGLEKTLRNMECYDYAVGIGELSGLGIKTVGCPKGGFKSWGKRRSELVSEHKNPKSIHYTSPEKQQLVSSTRTSVENKKCWGFWELQRGDELGYPEELGKDWYLVFSPRKPEGDPNYYDNAIIPVSGIKNFKLRPYNAHGM